jgi:hypothetical protein
MANQEVSGRMEYELVFQAVGRLAKRKNLRDVCLLEFEGGVILQGYSLISTTEGYQLVFKTHTLSHEDLKQLVWDL